MRTVVIASLLFLSFGPSSSMSLAKSPTLIGSWRGAGIVQPANGSKEITRCRAQVQKAPARGQYSANYRCSSAYGLVSQIVILTKVNSKHYTGSFKNTQFKIKGKISITLEGDRQTVVMRSPEGVGTLSLDRH